MRIADMNWMLVEEYLRRDDRCVLPLGSTEQHAYLSLSGDCIAFRADLTQQNGYLHAGVVTTIADSACGCAAFNLMPAGLGVLSVEFKANLLRPARGEWFVARAEVIKPGRTLSVVRGDVFAIDAKSGSELVATMQGTHDVFAWLRWVRCSRNPGESYNF